MKGTVVWIWFDDEGWYVQKEDGDNKVYVYNTKRSALRKAESFLNEQLESKEE